MKKVSTLDSLAATERITEYLRKAIVVAFDLARKRGSVDISVLDLFLAIMKDKKNIAARILEKLGVDLDSTISELEKTYISNYGQITTPVASEDFRQAISDAFLISSDFGHVYVGTEHMLLSILQFEEEKFVQDLKNVGIDFESVKRLMLSFGSYQPGIFSHMSEDEPEAEKRSMLGIYARDMNALGMEGKLMRVWGREEEIDRLIHILSRKTKNNPILVGEAGVGKTAIVEGLVHRVLDGKVPQSFRSKQFIQLDLAAIIAGSKIRGDVEERILAIVNEVSEDPNKVLFIDEIHMIVGAGSGGQGSMDVANILKPHLTSGSLRVIGATTFDEYQKYFEEDDALARRFQPVTVREIPKDDAYKVLKSIIKDFEDYHHVTITQEALDETVNLADRYITNRYFPDKAIDILDEAAAAIKIKNEVDIPDLNKLKQKLDNLKQEKSDLINAGEMESAVKKLKQEREINKEIEKIESKLNKSSKGRKKVSVDDIRRVVAEWTKIPVNTLTTKDIGAIQKIGPRILGRIIGQDNAVETVVGALKRSRVGIVNEKRPMSIFLFLGPSGVGKTELAKVIAKEVLGDENSLIQVDMSEYMEQHSVSKLIGSPPGYIGFQEGGQLTEKVKRNPYSVVLFDEIEKAHPDLLNILLQVMEEGMLKDSKGRSVNFRNTIIIMTSNIGATEIGSDSTLGFNIGSEKKEAKVDEAYDKMKEKLLEELKDSLAPEFLNRLDDVVIFKSLSEEDIVKIAKLQMNDLVLQLEQKDLKLKVPKPVIEMIAKEGYSEEYGARNIRRKIQEIVENPLAEELLSMGLVMGSKKIDVKLSLVGNKIKFAIKA